MKLKEGLEHKGRPFIIPNTLRRDFPAFFKEMGYKVGAEVGVYRAGYSEEFCKAGFKFYAIDPWAGYIGAGRTEKKQEEQDKSYEIAKDILSKYPNCTIIRKSSMDAVKDFEDGSLDFVYIDGDHRFRYIAEDIAEWIEKVRVGGIISGHDYWNTSPEAENVRCQVGAVVDAYVAAYKIEDFYITSNNRAPSWFWIRK